MTGIKLTDENGRTYGGTEWGPGVTHSAPTAQAAIVLGSIVAYLVVAALAAGGIL